MSVEGIRETRPLWLVVRFERDDYGLDDNSVDIASFWDRAEALAERDRLESTNIDPTAHHEIIEAEATVVYPSDEAPPWVPDADRLKKRGYEDPRPAD